MNMFAMNEDALPSHRVINSASFGQLEPLVEALKEGGDPNFIRVDISPTLITCMRGYIDCFKALIEHGARSDIPNKRGWTALHEAAQKEEMDFLQAIYEQPLQTRLRVKDHLGRTSLRAAMDADRFENAAFIIKQNPNLLEMDDNEGVRPILWAVINKNEDWLRWCLENGADASYTNEKGQSVVKECSNWEAGADILSEFSLKADLATPVDNKKSNDETKEVAKEKPEVASNPFGMAPIKKKR